MSADILQTILATKREEIVRGKQQISQDALISEVRHMGPTRAFGERLKVRAKASQDAVIAEIKKASPSAGLIRPDFDPVALARSYEKGGASALSVLTDETYFKGHKDFLVAARQAVDLPVIRKDFIVDEWQVWESRAMGADAVLLIVAALDDESLAQLCELAQSIGMDVLMEVHDEGELARALQIECDLIGINNRDLHVFQTDLNTSIRLAPMIPEDRLIVSESGIHQPSDIQRLQQAGLGAFLIGESLMRQANPGDALKGLFAPSH